MTAIAATACLMIVPPASYAATVPPLTDHQIQLVHKAETTINAIQTMKARFTQNSTDGSTVEGSVYISKPGRLRIEYDPPIPVLVVANGDYFTFVDKELNQYSYLSLDATPAGVLLKKSMDLIGADLDVLNVQEDLGIVNITVTSKTDPTVGNLSLIFTAKPFAFRQWQVTDAQGVTTSVTLQNMETGVHLNKDLFKSPKQP